MFHVEHRRESLRARSYAEAVGPQVRSLLAEYLESVSFAPDHILFLERMERLAALLAFWGAITNLTAAPEDSRETAFHILDSLAPLMCPRSGESLPQVFCAGRQVLDLGSGAGFPGLVLASSTPAEFTLVESRRKRASFLAVAASEMALKNVIVESSRVSTGRPLARRRKDQWPNLYGHFDVVTARAFDSPLRFYSAAASALKPGGIAILYANPKQNLAIADAEKNGLGEFRLIEYTVPIRSRVVERILAYWRRF
jgi:16S rRNA (guanine(527)-N(7))-methyltransferase RsmG